MAAALSASYLQHGTPLSKPAQDFGMLGPGSMLPPYAAAPGLPNQPGLWGMPPQQLPGSYLDDPAMLSMLASGEAWSSCRV